jgi:AraC-like DNA-binding protein
MAGLHAGIHDETASVFTVCETHGRIFRPGNRLIAHSEDSGWSSIHAAIIRSVRCIERARELLRNTSMPVVDVAMALGFSSQSYLSHWFLPQVGVSPAAYRRQS